LAYIAKRNAVIQWIRDFLESGKKLVVFGVHLHVLDDIEHMFADVCVRVDGHTKSEDRKLLEQKFQNDPSVQLFVGQVIAAGVALTLTAASSVAFVELPWTTADLDQAADRCHRIGQKDVVSVYFLIAKDTVEEKIMRYLDKKRTVVRKLLDGKEVESEDLLESLLVEYSKR
jgi:SWI/SNF-related matrix-associated actin-dependent regulator 1 of chromatin subfamily A